MTRAVPKSEWVSWARAAELAGCSVGVIEYARRTGRIRARERHGARATLDRDSVEAFAAARREADALRDEELSSLTTAARALGLSPSRVRQLVASGDLPGGQRGESGRWIVDVEALAPVAADRARWVTVRGAAQVTGLPRGAIESALRTGEVLQRHVARRRPSVDRRSVEEWAAGYRRRLAEEATVRAAAAAARAPSAPPEGGPWVTPVDAARLLGVGATRVRQLVATGRLPAVRQGRRIWLRLDQVAQQARARQLRREHGRSAYG